MKKLFRIGGVLVLIYLSVMAIVGLQYLFDRGDLKRASQFIYDYRPGPKQNKTVNELMAQALGRTPDTIFCQSEMASRSEGIVLMRCFADQQAAQATLPRPPDFEWLVHLVSYRLQPNNDKASQLLAKEGS